MTTPLDPVFLVMSASEAGASPDEIAGMLRRQISGIGDTEIAAAFHEAAQRLQQDGQAQLQHGESLRRLADVVDQIAVEEGLAAHPKTPIAAVLQSAARGNRRAAALLDALRHPR